MRRKRSPVALIAVALVAIVVVAGVVALWGVPLNYTYFVAVQDAPPRSPVQVAPRTGVWKVPLALYLTGKVTLPSPLPPEAGCAARMIRAGETVSPGDVVECGEYASTILPLPPESNLAEMVGQPAWYCVVAVGPGEREDWCSECLKATEEITSSLSVWKTVPLADFPTPTEYGLPEGVVCVSGWLGRPVTAKGTEARPCAQSEQGYDTGTTVFVGQGRPISTQSQKEDCTNDPPVSRELVVHKNAVPALALIHHYRKVVTPFVVTGNLPVAETGFWFWHGTWYALFPPRPAEPATGPASTPAPPITPTPTPSPIPTATPALTPTPVLTATLTPIATPLSAPPPLTPTPGRAPRIPERNWEEQ